MSDKGNSSASWRQSRAIGFAIIACVYVLGVVLGFAVYSSLHSSSFYLRLLAADVAATVLVWAFSLLLSNATVYDPYWSVQPIVILNALLATSGKLDPGSLLLCLVVSAWGVRLTYNWTTTFTGLQNQDWRYDLIKQRAGKFYQLANLIGIQMMPTLIVYSCILPAAVYITDGGVMTALTPIGLAISVVGLVLEAVADRQMASFRARAGSRSEINRTGLWGISRHPNYLGEIMMWWGVYIASVSAKPEIWHLGAGALLNTALFFFISIPMAERRLITYKAGFEEYRRQTPMLIPSLFGRRRNG